MSDDPYVPPPHDPKAWRLSDVPCYDPKIDGPTLTRHPNENHPVAQSPLSGRIVRSPWYKPQAPKPTAEKAAAHEAATRAERMRVATLVGAPVLPLIDPPADTRRPAAPQPRNIQQELNALFDHFQV